MYDPEALIQDADIEMLELDETARHIQALERRGICTHGRAVGLSESGRIFYPEQVGLKPGQVRCITGCGQVFESDEDWQEEMYAVLDL